MTERDTRHDAKSRKSAASTCQWNACSRNDKKTVAKMDTIYPSLYIYILVVQGLS